VNREPAVEDHGFLPFQEIKNDVIELSRIILLATCGWTTKPKTLNTALHRELYLLSKYFLYNPYQRSVHTTSSSSVIRIFTRGKYTSKILDTPVAGYASAPSPNMLEILERENSAFSAQSEDCWSRPSECDLNQPTAPMLLLTLPHLDTSELATINQKIDGLTLLHRIVNGKEAPICFLCIQAVLDCGGYPDILGEGKLNQFDLYGQSPIHFAKRTNKRNFFFALTDGEDMDLCIFPKNKQERELAKVEREREEQKANEDAKLE
jgi:hypothetical protein